MIQTDTQTLDLLGTGFCFEPDTARIAVTGGSYDNVEVVLDSLGFEETGTLMRTWGKGW